MKDISIITHKLAEVIRDMKTLGEIKEDGGVIFHKGGFKHIHALFRVSIIQYSDFSEGSFQIIKEVFEDAFSKETGYSVKVERERPCSDGMEGTAYGIRVAVVEEE